jgi:hypothetical protein
MKLRPILRMSALLCAGPVLAASDPAAPNEGNAALRYWMAFAQMDNPPVDGDLASRLGRIAEGEEPWDESVVPILDRNREALETMRRGSQLPSCDWGLEHELLAEAPIAHVSRARALARLNVLDGMRLMHEAKAAEAVAAWLAGLRFSRHVASDGPWLSALVAASGLRSHLRALDGAASAKGLGREALDRLRRALADLPAPGIDWTVPVRVELAGLSRMLALLERSHDPIATAARYLPRADGGVPDRQEIGRQLGLTAPQVSNIAAVRSSLRRARALVDDLQPGLVAAFGLPADTAADGVREIDARAGTDPLLARIWPSAARMNQARAELEREHAVLLGRLGR